MQRDGFTLIKGTQRDGFTLIVEIHSGTGLPLTILVVEEDWFSFLGVTIYRTLNHP